MGQCAQHNDYQSVCCTIMLQILERGKTGGLLMSIMGGVIKLGIMDLKRLGDSLQSGPTQR